MKSAAESDSTSNGAAARSSRHSILLVVLEVLAVFAIFGMFAFSPPPDVNEAHYLTKAKHYWNPAWCEGDLFLESSDAHLVFYWCIGWLTLLFSLPTVAWIGRIITWLLLAVGWQRLSWAILPRRGWSIVSAGLTALLIEYGHMAGEWVFGGVEAKGFAYFFFIMGLASLVTKKWNRVWIFFGIASAYHVLVGGWAVFAGGITWLLAGQERPTLRSMLPSLFVGGCLALPGLLPALWLTAGQDPETVRVANKIYVQHRLSHHLVFSTFAPIRIASHLILVLIWISLAISTRETDCRRLNLYVLAAVLIGVLGVAINQLTLVTQTPDLAFSVLRYYWFRLSDICVPMGVSLSGITLMASRSPKVSIRGRFAFGAAVAAIAIHLVVSVAFRLNDRRPDSAIQATSGVAATIAEKTRDEESWKRTCRWIRENTPPSARFLTPMRQQTFKWYAERPEVYNLKDVPQDAAALVEWWKRRREVYGSYDVKFGLLSFLDLHKAISELADEHEVDYLIVQKDQWQARLEAEQRLDREGKQDSYSKLGYTQVFPAIDDDNERFLVFALSND